MTGKKELIVSPVYNERGNIIGQEYHGEVIRCKDCKHWSNWSESAYCDVLCRVGMTEVDYCSRAERRSDD